MNNFWRDTLLGVVNYAIGRGLAASCMYSPEQQDEFQELAQAGRKIKNETEPFYWCVLRWLSRYVRLVRKMESISQCEPGITRREEAANSNEALGAGDEDRMPLCFTGDTADTGD